MSLHSVAETHPPKSDRDERREGILKVAYAAFLNDGYAATSMSSIAAKVGGSKATLYNYFSSKEELFAAVIEEKCRDFQELLFDAEVDTQDFRRALTRLVDKIVRRWLQDDNIATYRLITAETARFPELGRAFYMSGRHKGKQMLADYFARAQKAGDLTSADPMEMASLFLLLCKGELSLQKLWNVNPEPSEEDIGRAVAQTVSVFFAAYGARDKLTQ
jgi:AcrR family transcriptional regulator